MRQHLAAHSMRRLVPAEPPVELPVAAKLSAFRVADDGDREAVMAKTTRGYQGIFDTGATSTAIAAHVVDDLLLPVVDRIPVQSAEGQSIRTVHAVNMVLGDGVVFTGLPVVCMPLAGVDLLVGMDVIGCGDFRVSLKHGFLVVDFDMFIPSAGPE